MTNTVLIIEDDELSLKLENDLLQVNGYDTISTRDGEGAFELALEHRPDLIIMDIQLPHLSGVDITKKLKANNSVKDIPVIAVTAFALKGDKEWILESGCDAYLSKPISVPEFLKTIAEYID